MAIDAVLNGRFHDPQMTVSRGNVKRRVAGFPAFIKVIPSLIAAFTSQTHKRRSETE